MIERIWLRNFRRYVDEKITLVPGINFIDGQNNAGKSTILYAIEYALFGRVGQIKQIHTLMHPGAKEVGVELRFVGKDGKRYVLQRLHEKPPRSKSTVIAHFTLKVIDDDGERYVLSTDFQDKEEALALKLSAVLGVSRRLFDVAVHVKQGEIVRMLEGAPELDTVLGVTASVLAAEEMRAMALEAEKEAATLPVLASTLARLREDEISGEANEAALVGELSDIADNETRAQQTQEEAHAALSAMSSISPLMKALHDAADEVVRRRDDLARVRATVSDDVDALHALHARRATATATADVVAARQGEGEAQRRVLERRLGDLDGRITRRAALRDDDATCEACGQGIDHAHAKEELARWQAERHDVDAALVACAAALATDGEEARALAEAIAAVDAAVAAVAALADGEVALAAAAAAVRAGVVGVDVAGVADDALADHVDAATAARRDDLRDAVVRSETRLEALVARRVEAEAALTALRDRRREGARELAGVASAVERLQERAALAVRLRRLAAAYKELQVKLRDQAAAELGEAVFSLHKRLSAPDEEYKALSIDPARYVVNVVPYDIGTEVPAHLYQGGGHKVLLGLSFKLAVARRVGAVPFVLLDEPTYGLDEHRRSALLGRVAALDAETQMLFITHHDVGDVSGHHIRIVKKGKKSMQERA
jgi:exonuclease SbcC